MGIFKNFVQVSLYNSSTRICSFLGHLCQISKIVFFSDQKDVEQRNRLLIEGSIGAKVNVGRQFSKMVSSKQVVRKDFRIMHVFQATRTKLYQ